MRERENEHSGETGLCRTQCIASPQQPLPIIQPSSLLIHICLKQITVSEETKDVFYGGASVVQAMSSLNQKKAGRPMEPKSRPTIPPLTTPEVT